MNEQEEGTVKTGSDEQVSLDAEEVAHEQEIEALEERINSLIRRRNQKAQVRSGLNKGLAEVLGGGITIEAVEAVVAVLPQVRQLLGEELTTAISLEEAMKKLVGHARRIDQIRAKLGYEPRFER